MTIQKGLIGKEDISWGTSTFTRKNRSGQDMSLTQVYAGYVPILDSAGHFTGTDVETALAECMTRQEDGSSVRTLTNKSGSQRAAGDVVVIDTANDNSFTTTTTAGDVLAIGVVLETIANNAAGRIATSGYVTTITLNTAATRGQYIKTHTVAGQGTPTSTFDKGVFAVALSATSGVLFGALNSGSGSGLDADKVDGYNVGNTTGIIPLSNGTVCTDLNADKVDGLNAGAIVSGYTRSITTFIEAVDGSINTALTEGSLASGVSTTVGKTGSGASVIWTALDAIPATAVAVILRINNTVDVTATAGGAYYQGQYLYATKGDSSAPGNVNQLVSQCLAKDNAVAGGEQLAANNVTQAIVPITSTIIIKLKRSITSSNTTNYGTGINIYVCGWLE